MQVLWCSENSLTVGFFDEQTKLTEQVSFKSSKEMWDFIREVRSLYPPNILWHGYFGGHLPVKF